MPTVIQLCQRAILIKEGRLAAEGATEDVVQVYYDVHKGDEVEIRDLSTLPRTVTTNGGARLTQCRLATADRTGPWTIPFGSPVSLEITVTVERPLPRSSSASR